MEGVPQDAISKDEEQVKEINKKLEKFKSGSCTKSIRDDLKKKGNMIYSEESSRAIYEMGNLELCGVWLSTPSKYDGPNQSHKSHIFQL